MAITVNNVEYSWGSITLKIDGEEIVGFKAISYGEDIEREDVFGARRHKIAMTKGKVTNEPGSITMYLRQKAAVIARFGNGWADREFDIEVRYAEDGQPTHVDIIEGAKLGSNPGGGEEGASALEREMKFHFMKVCCDGVYMVKPNQ